MVRSGNGPGVELFQYNAPDQDQTFRRNSDWGGHHIAFYVRHIDKAVAYLQAKGVQKRLGPFAVGGGPAAGQTINYFRTPFGTYIELISYPHGMAYEATATSPTLESARQPPLSDRVVGRSTWVRSPLVSSHDGRPLHVARAGREP